MTLANALASSTALITSNSSDIITYFVAVIGALLILVLAKKAMFWVYKKIVSLFK
jgi:hypothetical protein